MAGQGNLIGLSVLFTWLLVMPVPSCQKSLSAIRVLAVLAISVLFNIQMVFAASSEHTPKDIFSKVELSTFVDKNQLPEQMVAKKQRLMLKPNAIQFSATLKAQPKPGQFSLVYEALALWGDGEMPEVTHSAFIGADDGHVLSVYVNQKAAEQLLTLPLNQPLNFYAIHIYNYAKGPRLIIVGAQAL